MNRQSLRLVLGINKSQYQLDGEYPNNNIPVVPHKAVAEVSKIGNL